MVVMHSLFSTRLLQSLLNLKLALRVCAAFRGCYLDYKEKADAIVREHVQEGEGSR